MSDLADDRPSVLVGFSRRAWFLERAEMVRLVYSALYEVWGTAVHLGINPLPDSVLLDSHEKMKYELRRMNLEEAQAWARGWLQGWPWVTSVVLAVEEHVRLSGRPWVEVWTLAEATARAKAQAAKKAQANEGAERILEWTKLEEGLGRRIVKELESLESLESSDMEMDIWRLRAKARCEAEVLALTLAGVWGWARRGARARDESVPPALADPSTIRCILTPRSLKSGTI